jgi:hypothetical protein
MYWISRKALLYYSNASGFCMAQSSRKIAKIGRRSAKIATSFRVCELQKILGQNPLPKVNTALIETWQPTLQKLSIAMDSKANSMA